MRIKFLGTSAAEGLPAVFCNCDNCKRARQKGGRNIRTRSQILIDRDTLFDFPMDTYMHALVHNIDLSAVKRVLITHSHMDHCYPQEFIMRGGPFAHGLTEKKVTVYCNDKTAAMFISDTAREIRDEVAKGIEVKVIHPFERLDFDDMTVIPLPAVHTVGEECLVYYVQRGGKGALFMNDTGVLNKDVFEKLYGMGAKVDFAAFDCTYGAMRHGPGRHMGMLDVVDQIELMEKAGLFNEGAVKYATHFSHNNELDYDEMCDFAAGYGINIAYDGCEVTV